MPLLLLGAPATAAPALRPIQERVDVGSFTIFISDQRAGREQFSLLRIGNAEGVAFELRSESAVDDRRTAMRLETDSAGTPIRYSVEERLGAEVSFRLGAQRIRGRFATLARSTVGESAREYLLIPDAIVLEKDGLLQHALLIRHRQLAVDSSVTISTLSPTSNRHGTVRLTLEAERDTVTIASTRLIARRWRAMAEGAERRLIWADAEGRLLRIAIPARALMALRDDVPRTM